MRKLAGVVVMCMALACVVPARAQSTFVPENISYIRFFNNTVAPLFSTEVAEASAATIGRVLPWVGYLTIAATVGGIIIHGINGEIRVRTRAQEDSSASTTPIITPTFPGAIIEWADSSGHFGATAAAVISYDAANNRTGACTLNGSSTEQDNPSGTPLQVNQPATCPNFGSVTLIAYGYMACSDGSHAMPTSSAPNETLATFQSSNNCAIPPPGTAQGGTEEWAPRTYPSTVPGGPDVTGWEAPSDPAVQPQPFTPANPMIIGTTNGVNAIATVTADPDGGYKVQTWSPSFTDPAHPTTQTGWTINTVTINNAGQVISSTQVITDTSAAPPTTGTGQPAGNGATNPNNTTAPPIVCGSLSCESTQQSVKTNTDVMKADLDAMKPDVAGIHTDTTGIHTDTTAILNELQATGAPTLADQQARLDAQQATDTQKESDIPTQIATAQGTDKSSWFSWVWTPPAGSCTNTTYTVSGQTFVLSAHCDWAAKARDLIGFILALFTSWNCYNVLFRPRTS